jgi:L-asparaginase
VASGMKGLVVAGTGNGKVHHSLEAALQRARQSGARVVLATRCNSGAIVPSFGDNALADFSGLTPFQARVELLLQLI